MRKKTSILTVSLLCLMLVSPLAEAAKQSKAQTEDADTYELLNLFGEVMERAKVSYVEDVSDKKLIESAINGMLSSLDPHSSFLDDQSFKYMSEQTKGKFGGLGIEVTMENGVVKVVSPIDDTPAAKAGLKPGDYITSIDGEQVMGLTLNEAVDKMRGKVGTKVKLTIRRINEKPLEVTLKREEIKIQSVKNSIKADDVVYIRISSFSEDVDTMTAKAIKDAKKKLGDKLKGVVIDVIFVLIRTDDVFDFIALRIFLPLYAACPETGNFNQKLTTAAVHEIIIAGGLVVQPDTPGNIRRDMLLDHTGQNLLPVTISAPQ